MRALPSRVTNRQKGLVAGIAVLALAASACGSNSTPATSQSTSTPGSSTAVGSSTPAGSSPAGPTTPGSTTAGSTTAGSSGAATGNSATATSLASFGGMSGLVAAANKEGALNVIALPPAWADYQDVIAGFQAKYPGIKVTSQQPDANSQQEIQAAQTSKGTSQAPDVFDIGAEVALANTATFAPYQVAAWKDIPAANKEATGLFVNDYTGVMTVGYDATALGHDMTSLNDLKDSKLKGAVALNGDPTQATSGLLAVMMASLANGGSLSDISKGVDFFGSLKQAGTLSNTKASAQVVSAGTISAIIDWSYNQQPYAAAAQKNGDTWKTFTPAGVNLVSYYDQAINKDAPHPAAARLWEEYLYSSDAQNFWIKGGALPILYNSMKTANTISADDAKNLPAISGAQQSMTDAQTKAANTTLAATWSKAVG